MTEKVPLHLGREYKMERELIAKFRYGNVERVRETREQILDGREIREVLDVWRRKRDNITHREWIQRDERKRDGKK